MESFKRQGDSTFTTVPECTIWVSDEDLFRSHPGTLSTMIETDRLEDAYVLTTTADSSICPRFLDGQIS